MSIFPQMLSYYIKKLFVFLQMDDTVSKGQNQIQSSHLKVPLDSDAPESSTLSVREFRWYKEKHTDDWLQVKPVFITYIL